MSHRAFAVVYSGDVERAVRFYELLGFEVHLRLPEEGEVEYVGLRRGASELGVVTARSPDQYIGVPFGAGPRFELYVYVDDVDACLERVRDAGVRVFKDPADMPWGERVAYIADADGNPVALAEPKHHG